MKKNILVTGNTGYIGPVMTQVLKEKGYTVTGLDYEYYKGCELFEPPARADRQICKDIRDVNADDLQGVDAIVHLSALSNDPLGELNPGLTGEINTKASLKLAELAKKAGVRRFIFSSSCSVYGISDSDTPLTEQDKINPITAYAKAKVDVEQGLMKMADKDFHPVYMRNATVYGLSPMLRLDLVVNNLTAWAFFTGKIEVMSDGSPWRPIVHIRDFSEAFAAAIEAPEDAVHNQIFNVGQDAENYRVREIADRVKNIVPGSVVEILNKTGSDERSYRVAFGKIKRVLPGFKPRFTVDMGIKELYQAYKDFAMNTSDLTAQKYFRVRWIKQLMENKILDNNLKRI